MDSNTLLAIRYILFVVLVLAVLIFPQNLGMTGSDFVSLIAGLILPTTHATKAVASMVGK